MTIPTATIDADSDISYGAGSYVIRFEISRLSSKKLVLTAVNEDEDGYVTYFLDNGNKAHLSSLGINVDVDNGTKVGTVIYKVEAKLYNASDTEFETPLGALTGAALQEFQYDNASYGVKYTVSAEDSADTPVAHDAYIHKLSADEIAALTAEPATYAEGSFFADPENAAANKAEFLVNTGSWDGANTVVGYFAVRVDGGAHAGQSTDKLTTGAVTVTVTAGDLE